MTFIIAILGSNAITPLRAVTDASRRRPSRRETVRAAIVPSARVMPRHNPPRTARAQKPLPLSSGSVLPLAVCNAHALTAGLPAMDVDDQHQSLASQLHAD